MGIKKITSRAPTRIDLAGGTIDIWPIYLFLKNPLTLNLAIDLYAEATIEEGPEKDEVLLESADQNLRISMKVSDLFSEEKKIPGGLVLHYKLLRYFAEKKDLLIRDLLQKGLKLSTDAKSPAGAGLGGSSSLSIAIIGALAKLASYHESQNFIDIVRDVETTVIQIPAGLQDYYAAMYGGLQSLHWRPGIHERGSHPVETLKELESRLLLFYSGQSRNSGINNWNMFKSFIDREDPIPKQFEKIGHSANQLEQALSLKDWDQVGLAIQDEWEARKTLAQHITTPIMDQAFLKAKDIAHHSVGKVCGAGGGGCFFLYFPENNLEKKKEILAAFSDMKLTHLPFSASPKGLTVREEII